MAWPSVASLALPSLQLPKAVLTPPRHFTSTPPPEGWLGLNLRPRIPRMSKSVSTKSCFHRAQNLRTASKTSYPTSLRWFSVYACVLCRMFLRHAAPTPRRRGARQGPGRSLRSLTTVVLTSLKRGAPKEPLRLGRWAVRRFVCGRATRTASLASRSGTSLPPEG